MFKAERLPRYEEVTRYDYGLMLAKIEAAMSDLDVAEINAGHVMDLRRPRSANKYQALLSVLMTFAIGKRLIVQNPCRDVEKLPVKRRRVYQAHDTTAAIMEHAIVGKRGYRNANGPMYAGLFALAYLTAARVKDVRLLRWADINEAEILLEPTKTKASSGAKIAIAITPAIAEVLQRVRELGKVKSLYVFHSLKGGPLSASAVKSAWRRARERAGHTDAWLRDLRPKALSDAKRAGLTLEHLADAAGHASVTTTESYLRGFEVKEANLGLSLPVRKVSNSGGGT
jgi:integrase